VAHESLVSRSRTDQRPQDPDADQHPGLRGERPGEAAEADIGAAGERGQWQLFKQGKPLGAGEG
jgi:hypothetical protein